jgi:SPP1 gp7 family putative phage head morphogenesis protein
MARLYTVANRYKKRLRALEDKAMKQMQRAYTASFQTVLNDLNRLEIQINKMIADGRPDVEIYQEMQSFYEKKLNAIENKIEAFNRDAIEITKDLQKESVKVGTEYSKDNLQASLGKPPAGFTYEINVIDAGAMEQFVGFASNGSPLNDLFQKIVVDYGTDITNTLSNGILQGQNPLKIAREIRKNTSMPLYRANTIARTESHRASRAATVENYGKNQDLISGYVRLATGDARTCPACFALHGTVYTLNQILPTHPNCRCIIVPKTKTWAEITGDATIEDVSDKIPTANDLFNKLSEKQKKRVLGPERYNLYKDGMPLRSFVDIKQDADWGPTTYIKPLRDIR